MADIKSSYDALNEEQILGCIKLDDTYGFFNKEYFNANVKPVLQNARQYLIDKELNYSFPVENYTKVYVTSDIHSDYRKFVELLVNADIIEIPEDIYPYNNGIYSMELITNTVWKQNNVALFILGDVIDGCRGDGLEVDDNQGYFEFFLHAFLYNLRLKALEKNSLLVFTFGNHDFHALLQFDDYMLNTYVVESSKYFFGQKARDNETWKKNRKDALLPFYEVQPTFLVEMYNAKSRIEFLGIHGGFHNPSGKPIGNLIEDMQEKINQLPASVSLETLKDGGFFDPVASIEGGLWTRFYEDLKACEKIVELDQQPIIIVGHCSTMMPGIKLHQETMDSNPKLYTGCDRKHGDGGRGCVVSSCNNKLVHVDVGMSAAFYNYFDKSYHAYRDAEILILSHDPMLNTSERYFNVMQRFSKTGGLIDVYNTPAIKRPRAKAGNSNVNLGIDGINNIVGGKYARKSLKRKNKRRQTRRRR